MLSSLLLIAAVSASSPCDEAVSAAQLRRSLDLARTAWVVMDRSSFELATTERREALACLDEAVVPELALELHLHEALARSLERRSDLAQGAFRAILALQPEWRLPLELAPEQHRLRQDFDEARAGTWLEERRAFSIPDGGSLLVDGVPAVDVPVDRPFVVQMLDGDEGVLRTHYFTPGSEASLTLGPGSLDGGAVNDGRGLERRGPLLLGGAMGAGLAAGGLYAAAALRAQAMEQGEVPCEQLSSTQGGVNGMVGASAGLAALGLGLGVAGVMVVF